MYKDFKISIYRRLLQALQTAGYTFFTFSDWCEGKAAGIDKFILLRHDIDKSPGNALIIAVVEAELGIHASYYWLSRKSVFNSEIIQKVAALGHEIGYHYEDLTQFNGNYAHAIAHFEKQLTLFRKLYPVKTVSMHGSPLSRFDNRDIWKQYDYRSFGIIGEPYIDVFGSSVNIAFSNEIYYLTDTGRMWNGDRFSVRDKVKFNRIKDYRTTKQLINAIESGILPQKVMITTHPQRWTDSVFDWYTELLIQGMKNLIKRVLIIFMK